VIARSGTVVGPAPRRPRVAVLAAAALAAVAVAGGAAALWLTGGNSGHGGEPSTPAAGTARIELTLPPPVVDAPQAAATQQPTPAQAAPPPAASTAPAQQAPTAAVALPPPPPEPAAQTPAAATPAVSEPPAPPPAAPPPTAPAAPPAPAAVASAAGAGVLAPAPDPGLVERRGDAVLPVIGRDGRRPLQVYARPFDRGDTRPRIALVVSGLGLMAGETQAAVQQFPAPVSLAFSPHARKLQDWVDQARAAGHEVLLNLPMEPFDFPRQDPGQNTLLTAVDAKQNIERLEWVMSRASGYVGLAGFRGSRFLASANDVRPVLEAIKARGLLFLDNGASSQSTTKALATQIGLVRAANDRFVDLRESRVDIEKRLAELEDIAKRTGSAVGIARPLPATIDLVAAWAQGLAAKDIVLAPVSAVAAQPETPRS
jgi:hypothetical protein